MTTCIGRGIECVALSTVGNPRSPVHDLGPIGLLGLDVGLQEPYYRKFAAGVAKLVYALDSKSSGLNAHVGSTPTLGTTIQKRLWSI